MIAVAGQGSVLLVVDVHPSMPAVWVIDPTGRTRLSYGEVWIDIDDLEAETKKAQGT